MKILFILYSFKSGGAEKQALWLAQRCVGLGHKVVLFELTSGPNDTRLQPLLKAAQDAGVVVNPAQGRPIRRLWDLVATILRQEPGLVWSWGFRADACGLVARMVTPWRWTWLLSLRCADRADLARKQYPHALFHMWADGVVANSRQNVAMLHQVFYSPCKYVVLYNTLKSTGLRAMLPGDRPQKFRVVMLGNLKIEHKGYDLVLEVAEGIKRRKWGMEIHIAGREDDGGWLRRTVAERDLGRICIIHGETRRPEEFLRSGSLFLMMSRYEGTPNAFLEALDASLPSIITAVADIPHLITDGDQARVIAVGSVAECLQALEWAWGNWARAVAMGARGRAWCLAQFSEERCEQNLAALLDGIGREEAQTAQV